MTSTSCRVAAVVAMSVVAFGCDTPAGNRTGSTASAMATVAADELGALCQRMCDKDVACAGETARESAKAAGLDGVADEAAAKATEKARQDLPSCKADCIGSAKQGAAGGQAQAKAIERCLAARGCAEYTSCVGRIAAGGTAE